MSCLIWSGKRYSARKQGVLFPLFSQLAAKCNWPRRREQKQNINGQCLALIIYASEKVKPILSPFLNNMQRHSSYHCGFPPASLPSGKVPPYKNTQCVSSMVVGGGGLVLKNFAWTVASERLGSRISVFVFVWKHVVQTHTYAFCVWYSLIIILNPAKN